MNRFIVVILALSSALFSQTALPLNTEGIRVPSAKTLEQGHFYVSGLYGFISDGEALSVTESYTATLGGEVTDINQNTAAGNGNIELSYGIWDFLELNLALPIYYESETNGTQYEGMAIGDFRASLKASTPIKPVYIALGLSIFAPSGDREKGFRPRHSWYIKQDERSYAYTAGETAAAGTVYLTIDIMDKLIQWNSFGGFVSTISASSYAMLWGTGFSLNLIDVVSLNIEISGETPFDQEIESKTFLNNGLWLTTGFHLHLPHATTLIFGVDFGINFIREIDEEDGVKVIRKNNDKEIQYIIPGTPKIGINLGLSKEFNFSWKDSDNDGIPDRKDFCPGSAAGITVNSRGCPVDKDQDGVLDIIDDCSDTPLGVNVDYFGCPLDEDQDSVPDYMDKCPGTPAGEAVDENGCKKDSDNDGIDDNSDRCPGTIFNMTVDEVGCPLDSDGDGVMNAKDSCPNTPAGISVDSIGCPLDMDKDGIPDDIDRCPNGEIGEIVDSLGCPADSDKDGVPDSKDQCPNTMEAIPVNQFGCPLDGDGDGVPDGLDKCPNTPEKAPVDTLGCPIDSDGDGIHDYLDKCPSTFKDITVDSQGCPTDPRLNLNLIAQKVAFLPNSNDLTNSSFTALNDVVQLMRQYPINLEIQGLNAGHLSTIVFYLESKGILKNRINARSFITELPQDEEYKNWNKKGIRFIPR